MLLSHRKDISLPQIIQIHQRPVADGIGDLLGFDLFHQGQVKGWDSILTCSLTRCMLGQATACRTGSSSTTRFELRLLNWSAEYSSQLTQGTCNRQHPTVY